MLLDVTGTVIDYGRLVPWIYDLAFPLSLVTYDKRFFWQRIYR